MRRVLANRFFSSTLARDLHSSFVAVRAAHFEGDSKPLDMDITLGGIALDGGSLGAKASRLSGLRGSPAWFVAECV